jgi:hypothetical protein
MTKAIFFSYEEKALFESFTTPTAVKTFGRHSFISLKKKLNINSSITVLAKHFADGLQSLSTNNRIGSHLAIRIDL